MRYLWSEDHKRRLMRQIWVALASAQHAAGLVTKEQLDDLRNNVDDIDVELALEIEREIRHDVMAEIRAYAQQCLIGGGIIHWGATSADITDNVDVLRQREAARIVVGRASKLLSCFSERIQAWAHRPCMAFTHVQPAEPTTLGYRLAVYAQDLLHDLIDLTRQLDNLHGKGLKGAVGTQASFQEILRGTGVTPSELEAQVMAELDLQTFPVATQTYTRRQDYRMLAELAGIAASLHKFALDFRLMQSPAIGEWFEPFADRQVGSSTMPFKRNPILSENICSLARFVSTLPNVAWQNASQAILERSLDDSANRRLTIPEAFLATEEMLIKAQQIMSGMSIDESAIERNLTNYGPFAGTERLLMALVASGADRQQSHEWIREASLLAWSTLRSSGQNPLVQLLEDDERITRYLAGRRVKDYLAVNDYTGTAGERAEAFAETIRGVIESIKTETRSHML